MSTEAAFDDHIEEIVAQGGQRTIWIWRTFRRREAAPMITPFRALVLPNFEYCCQIWAPLKAGSVRKLESVQRIFTSMISGTRELQLNYCGRLKHLGLYSLERRGEIYIILYTWKIITVGAPNFESETSKIVTNCNERRRD
jgi:hypothetical protein